MLSDLLYVLSGLIYALVYFLVIGFLVAGVVLAVGMAWDFLGDLRKGRLR